MAILTLSNETACYWCIFGVC